MCVEALVVTVTMWKCRPYLLRLACFLLYWLLIFVTYWLTKMTQCNQLKTVSMWVVTMGRILVHDECHGLLGVGEWPQTFLQPVTLNLHLGVDAPSVVSSWGPLPCCLRGASHSQYQDVPCRISVMRGELCYSVKWDPPTWRWRWWGRQLQGSHHIWPEVKTKMHVTMDTYIDTYIYSASQFIEIFQFIFTDCKMDCMGCNWLRNVCLWILRVV